jgi:hypothetical protein
LSIDLAYQSIICTFNIKLTYYEETSDCLARITHRILLHHPDYEQL